MLDAMVWSVGDVEGLEHQDATPPEVPDPEDLPDARRRAMTWTGRGSPSGATSTSG